MGVIYKITCLKNNKIYIGQSIVVKKRIENHFRDLRKNRHYNKGLQEDYNKYGEKNFNIEILEECKKSELNEKEKYYIHLLKSLDKDIGYNINKGDINNEIAGQIKLALWCLMDRSEIMKKFNVSRAVLTSIAMGVNFRDIYPELNEDINDIKQKLIDERNNEIVQKYNNGMRIVEIVKETGYSTSVVEKAVYRYTDAVIKSKSKYQEMYLKTKELAKQGLKAPAIAKELNIGTTTVYRYLRDENNPFKELPYKKITKDLEPIIKDLYFNQGKTIVEIAKMMGVAETTMGVHITNYKHVNTEVN